MPICTLPPLQKDSDSTTLSHLVLQPHLSLVPFLQPSLRLSSSSSPTGEGKKPGHPEERCQPHPCHFQSNRGRGAPSLPPNPALTLALTGLLRGNWVLVGGGGIMSVSSNLLILGCTSQAAVRPCDPLPLPLVSRPQQPGAETLRKCQ